MRQTRSTHSTRRTVRSTPAIFTPVILPAMLPVMLIALLAIQQPGRIFANDDSFTQVLAAQQERIRTIETAAKTSVSIFAGSSGF